MASDRTIAHNGLTFAVSIEHDDTMGEPWMEHDGHGVVTGYERRNKAPHERLLHEGRVARRFYDVTASTAIARRDGWGIAPELRAELERKAGRALTAREVTAAAVDADYRRLRDWCEGRWGWVGIVVTLLDVDGEPTGERESLWGVESDAGNYLDEEAQALAEQIAECVGDADTLEGPRIRAAREVTP